MKKLMVSILCAVLFSGVSAGAQPAASSYIPYSTYVYDYEGNPVETPHAYIPGEVYSGESLGVGEFDSPSDIFVDHGGNIYIADTRNNRIVILNSEFKEKRIISKFGDDGFAEPKGLFVDNSGHIFVADTGNGRIVEFGADFEFLRTIGAPDTPLLSDDFIYAPTALSTDKTGHIYVVAAGANMGLIHFSPAGEFVGFLGAQKVTYNPIDYFWKNLLSQAQRDRMSDFVPTEYNNIAMDSRGFLFVSSSALEKDDFISAIQSHRTSRKGLPVRCLNPMGADVLHRGGYFPPMGDISYEIKEGTKLIASVIEDVAVNKNGSYTLMDTRKNRLFTYSKNGELLYSFSAPGAQVGNSLSPVSICYMGDELLVLDGQQNAFTCFKRTEYGALIDEAIDLYSEYDFEKSVEVWNRVLSENANFDIAYDGIGAAELRTKQYKSAMECFLNSNNKMAYSQAFRAYRGEFVQKNVYLLPVIGIALIAGLLFLFKFISKRVKASRTERTRAGTVYYGFHMITHPFSGFWDMKHERRGSYFGATLILALAVFTLIMRSGFINPLFGESGGFSPIAEIFAIIIPLFLWVVVNWSVTTLMDGKGSIGDIYKFTAYSALPVLILVLPSIPISHLLVLEEGIYLTALLSISFVWAGGLIFCGNITIHDYTIKKSLLSVLITVVGMGIVIFIALLIFTTYQKIFGFFGNIYKELFYR